MNPATAQSITISVSDTQRVSGLLQVPPNARACYVMAHGAGAGMTHSFMAAAADGLAERGIATLRYQFLYMEQGSKRPDSPKLAHAAVRAAVLETARRLPDLPLFAGGKSFGGRMTSQAQAASPLAGVRGLVFFGFPLHPPGKPSNERATLNLFQDADHSFHVPARSGRKDSEVHVELLDTMVNWMGKTGASGT